MKKEMTITEKILARKLGREVEPGEFLLLEVDVGLGNDITAPLAIKEFQKYGGRKVFNPDKIVLVLDHFTPNKDIKSAQQSKLVRCFAQEQGIKKFFDEGRGGIEHVLLPEEGLIKPGDLVVGADSHTCTYGALGALAVGVGSTDLAGVFLCGQVWLRVPETIKIELVGNLREYVSGKDIVLKILSIIGVDGANYKVLEFGGNGVKKISMDSRFTISNMAVEAGAKTGVFPVDDKTVEYCQERGIRPVEIIADPAPNYAKEIKLNLDDLDLQVAYPYLPSKGKDIQEAAKEKIKIDQVVIGSCTNGRMEDLRMAASILKGGRVYRKTRCIIIPGSQQVYYQALKEGLIEIFVKSDCVIAPPTCGPCLGGHMGVVAEGEKVVATTNRNFVGRMGHPRSEIYLASPAVAAASALKGYICGPQSI